MRSLFSQKETKYEDVKRNYRYDDNIKITNKIDYSKDIDLRPLNYSINSNSTLKCLL